MLSDRDFLLFAQIRDDLRALRIRSDEKKAYVEAKERERQELKAKRAKEREEAIARGEDPDADRGWVL